MTLWDDEASEAWFKDCGDRSWWGIVLVGRAPTCSRGARPGHHLLRTPPADWGLSRLGRNLSRARASARSRKDRGPRTVTSGSVSFPRFDFMLLETAGLEAGGAGPSGRRAATELLMGE
jgi:hypothetical protein